MTFGLTSRILGRSSHDFQNGSSVQLRDCVVRNNGRNFCKVPRRGAFDIRWLNLEISFITREGAFQFVNLCKGVDEPKAFERSTPEVYSGPSRRASTSRLRPPRPHCYACSAFDVNMPNTLEWRLSRKVPVETANSVRNKDPCFPAITERRNAANCHVSQPESSYLVVRCNADSSDKGKVCQFLMKPAR